MQFAVILFAGILTQGCWASESESDFAVKTVAGYVRGIKSTSRNGVSYTAFRGIQYGVQTKRFQEAEPVERWEGVKDTFDFGSDCAQANAYRDTAISLEENCLFLNVYVPEIKGGKSKKPVIVYIHGGAWAWGTSRQVGEKFFMDKDVVFVTINYRVGPFGFLAVKNNRRAQGNVASLDQIMALEWVQKNIHNFGGDPNLVTIMGESAGAGSVAHLLVSPLSEGMFHRAIQQSGAYFNPWTWRSIEDAQENVIKLSQLLGCSTDSDDEIIDCLMKQNVQDILVAHNKLMKFYFDPLIRFPPVADESNRDAFMASNPADAIREGRFNRVPTIFTACADEGLLFHAASIVKSEKHITALNENWAENGGIQALIDEDPRLPKLNSEEKQRLMTTVWNHYFGKGKKLKVNDPWTLHRLTEFYSDRYFFHGIRETALAMSQYTPVYVGLFTDVGAESVITRLFGYNQTLGVAHADDLQFFFHDAGFGPFPHTPELKEFSEGLIDIWVNFAATGVPSGTVAKERFEWPKVGEEERKSQELDWIDLGKIPERVRIPFSKRLKIWDQVYEQFGNDQAHHDEL